MGVITGTVLLSMAGASAAAASPRPAAATPVTAGLTITPATATVGSTVTIVGTATNTTDGTVSAALGIDNYGGLRASSVSGSTGCTPRNLTHLVYCGIPSLGPHATARITLTLVPPTSGSYDFRDYARITLTTDDSYAYGTLVVS